MERIRIRILASYTVVSGTKRSLHDTTGGAEDIGCTRTSGERIIQLDLVDLTRRDVLHTQETVHLTSRQYDIDIRITLVVPHRLIATLGLLRKTWHDGYTVDAGRIYAELLREVALDDRTEHLLR